MMARVQLRYSNKIHLDIVVQKHVFPFKKEKMVMTYVNNNLRFSIWCAQKVFFNFVGSEILLGITRKFTFFAVDFFFDLDTKA